MKRGIKEFKCDVLKTKEGEDSIAELKRLRITMDNMVESKKSRLYEIPTDNNTFSFGLIGDTHIGSLYEALGELHSFYNLCEKEGINTILHAGDVLDGFGMYKGQQFEQSKMGWDSQYKHFVNNYPRVKGMKTYFIAGNHDQSFSKIIGMNVGKALMVDRDDMVFLGNDNATVKFKTPSNRDFVARLSHPGGGSAYAVSYRTQKIIESLTGGTKPHVLGVGHLHKADMLPSNRNICGIQTGCFQWQTPFMAGKASPAHVGGWRIGFTVGSQKSLSNDITAKFAAFYHKKS